MLNYRDKTRLVDYHIESRYMRLTTEEGYDFAFMPEGFKPEASWRYDEYRHRHNIILATDLDKCANRKLWSRGRLTFAQRIYDHEGAHSLFTGRDNKRLTKLQEDAKIPFHLWNLMEDARIEAKWRKTFHRRFGWMRYLTMIDEDEHPILAAMKALGKPDPAIRLFLDCTRMENSPKLMEAWVKKNKDPKIQFEGKGDAKYDRRVLIRWYFRRAIHAPTTEEIIPIVQSWIKTFPETGGGDGEGSGGLAPGEGFAGPHGTDMPDPKEADKPGAGAMPEGAEDADGSKHKEIKETVAKSSGASESSDTPAKKDPPRPDFDPKEKHADKKLDIPRNHFFRPEKLRTIDTKRGDALIRLFEKFLEGGEGTVTSRNPTNKIDFNKFMRGADDIYLRKGDDPYGVKEISFIMDASGSMSGVTKQGCYLAYVLNELVRSRKINCKHLILSGGNYFKLPMPFDPRLLEHLHTPGGTEGFVNTMRMNEAELVASDLTIFFTDGIITDEHIKKEEWHRKGVYTIGLYVGEPEMSESLHQWFDSVLVRREIESIADSLVQLIKRQ